MNPLRTFFLNSNRINDFVFLKNNKDVLNKTYDIGIVLGCKDYEIMQSRIKETLGLYEKKIINKVLLSGGIGYFSKHRHSSEATVMKEYLLENGVKENDILIENKSRDTYENMTYSLKLISKENLVINHAIIITSEYHAKRALTTFKKLSSIDAYVYGIKDNKHDYKKWSTGSVKVRFLIRLESFLLAIYTKKFYKN